MATRSSKQDQRARAEVLLCRNLKHARALAGLSQAELGRAAGVDSQQISKWERGVMKPSNSNLAALAETLRRDLSWFYTEQEMEEAV